MDDQVESVLLAEMIAKQPLERQKVLIQRLSMLVINERGLTAFEVMEWLDDDDHNSWR